MIWLQPGKPALFLCNWLTTSIYLPLSLRQTLAIHRAATKGRQGKGCVVIVPAGNANRPLDGIIFERNWGKDLPEGATQWLSGLALHPDVITVAACTSYNQKAAYSNWGSMVSVCAPSDNAIPCIWRSQQQLIPTTPQADNLSGARVLKKEFEENGHGFGGTEFAAALVAGIAALTISANPNLTANQVREVLETTADKIIDPNPDRQLGLEMGSYEDNGHSEWFGYGRVNAKQAVERAIHFE
ncbi:MAG: S8 family serine peptidase [Synechococcaceae cyanobacterium RL_1_2]|nr:S8 family serine peptidase [Synechococcaceae cyanobacterium RL_1_2]